MDQLGQVHARWRLPRSHPAPGRWPRQNLIDLRCGPAVLGSSSPRSCHPRSASDVPVVLDFVSLDKTWLRFYFMAIGKSGPKPQLAAGEEVAGMQARDRETNLYAVLGVDPSATAEVITSAFRARVRELRPDTRVDAATATRFGEVRAAYETLRDPALRAAYDQTRERTDKPAPGLGRAAAPPARRCTVVLGATRPEPPLRAGPVRWEPMSG
ncbi:J domain-containing protein [Streptomyces sp. HMX87]|uniref:J domain-containing protein n=1 Tax=Streptomyces sp. HMX87 TaxID=3390849 RepID=UPI003A8980DA